MVRKKPLSALVFRGSSGLFVAMCLELDLAAQSRTPEAAVEALEENFRAHIRIAERRGEQPFERAKPAPQEYWNKFESASLFAGASPTFDHVRVIGT